MSASNNAKGNRAEKLAEEILIKQGYITERAKRTMKAIFTPKGRMYVSQRNDIFQLFDLCAKRKDKTRWIQVKYGESKTHVYDSKKKIQEFHKHINPLYETIEIWYKKPRQPWEVIAFDGDEWVGVNDETNNK